MREVLGLDKGRNVTLGPRAPMRHRIDSFYLWVEGVDFAVLSFFLYRFLHEKGLKLALGSMCDFPFFLFRFFLCWILP